MPKCREFLRSQGRNRVIINCSSSDEMDTELNSKTKDIKKSLKKNKVPKRRTLRTTPKRSRLSSVEKANISSSKEPNMSTKTNTTNNSIIELDDSEDESKYSNINERVQGKIDKFFKSSGLISDDEDELLNVKISAKQNENSNKGNVPSKSVTANINEDCVLIEDDTSRINTLEDIENYCKETENLLKDANALLDKFAGNSNENTSELTKSPTNEREKGLGECPICYDKLAQKQVMSTQCGHLFCKDCIERIVKTVKKCPTCRKTVNKKKIFSIFI
ncbi:hypothetical protein WA026_006089 [Henosepilachna vigintioctopunctata]|uniref:RING-type domain-containing protein n=1 Tax=Henosepilachna vigintioctopunctata TaxID=420089 RepID=A0AAW1TQF1_9CUCU